MSPKPHWYKPRPGTQPFLVRIGTEKDPRETLSGYCRAYSVDYTTGEDGKKKMRIHIEMVGGLE